MDMRCLLCNNCHLKENYAFIHSNDDNTFDMSSDFVCTAGNTLNSGKYECMNPDNKIYGANFILIGPVDTYARKYIIAVKTITNCCNGCCNALIDIDITHYMINGVIGDISCLVNYKCTGDFSIFPMEPDKPFKWCNSGCYWPNTKQNDYPFLNNVLTPVKLSVNQKEVK